MRYARRSACRGSGRRRRKLHVPGPSQARQGTSLAPHLTSSQASPPAITLPYITMLCREQCAGAPRRKPRAPRPTPRRHVYYVRPQPPAHRHIRAGAPLRVEEQHAVDAGQVGAQPAGARVHQEQPVGAALLVEPLRGRHPVRQVGRRSPGRAGRGSARGRGGAGQGSKQRASRLAQLAQNAQRAKQLHLACSHRLPTRPLLPRPTQPPHPSARTCTAACRCSVLVAASTRCRPREGGGASPSAA